MIAVNLLKGIVILPLYDLKFSTSMLSRYPQDIVYRFNVDLYLTKQGFQFISKFYIKVIYNLG